MKKQLLSILLLICTLHSHDMTKKGEASDTPYLLLNGTDVSRQRKEKLKEKCKTLNRMPHLAIVHVEDGDASKRIYIERKIKAFEDIGFGVTHTKLPRTTTQQQLEQLIREINADKTVDGMIVQLPLPATFDQWRIIDTITPEKDVDGLTSSNMGNIKRKSQHSIKPATAKGIVTLLKHYRIDTHGKECVVIGGSELVGHPVQVLLSREDNGITIGGATVTLCHKETADLKKHTREADIIIVAVGHPNIITADMVKKGAIIIDAGISRQGKKIVGDVAFDTVAPKCTAITPVPGGVGPMTVVSLLENLYKAYMQAKSRS